MISTKAYILKVSIIARGYERNDIDVLRSVRRQSVTSMERLHALEAARNVLNSKIAKVCEIYHLKIANYFRNYSFSVSVS